MSYQVLARKWRPSQFQEVVGQTHVLEPLRHALNNNRLHHAYLFTGTRGVGKTTIARILAKALNCQQGISAEPCGQCESCLQIDQGRFVDLLEIDAASRTKVEDTRELLDNVQYRPTQGRYKVYLIDEVHMLSRHSFNALLKTLEEPPEHVKFLLATTDPQKLPVTVVSRCLQFNLRALTADLIGQQLQHVLSAENISVDEAALPLIARAARGSMRDGLSLTDQAIAQGSGAVNLESVQQMLGNVPQANITALLEAVINHDGNAVFSQLDQMVALVPDVGVILTELQALLHRLALVQQLPQLATENERSDAFKLLLRQLPAEVIQLYYRLVLEGRKEQPYSVDERSGVEMTLLRLLAFKPTEGLTISSAAQEIPEQQVPQQAQRPHSALSANSTHAAEYEPNDEMTAFDDAQLGDAEQRAESMSNPDDLGELLKMRDQLMNQPSGEAEPATEKKNKADRSPLADAPAQHTSEPDSAISELPESERRIPSLGGHKQQLPELTPEVRRAEQVDDWSALVAAMNIDGLGRQLLLNSNLVKCADKHWQIKVSPAQQSLLSAATETAVREALAESLSAQGKFEFMVEEPQTPTPLMIQQHIDAYRHQLAVEWLQNDIGVAELRQRFAAEVDEATIKAV